MFKRAVTIIGLALALASSAAAQQPQTAIAYEGKNPAIVSVVHRVDLHKLIRRLREQQNARVGVPGSAPETIINVATGLAIDSQGHVVTRLAYVDPEDRDQKVSVVTSEGRELKAQLIGVDCATGFSVLEVESLKASPPPFAEQKIVSDGLHVRILSADYVPKPGANEKTNEIYISPSIRITHGQVGTSSIYSKARGAYTLRSTGLLSRYDSSIVTTDSNQVIGIAQYAGYGRAYLFPIDFIRDTVTKRVLERKGSVPAGWLGVYGDSLAQIPDTERGAIGVENKMGVLVRDFAPNSPAFESGLLLNDVIVGINGFDITGSTDLSAVLSSLPAGYEVQLRVLRSKKSMEMKVELGEKGCSPPTINLGEIVDHKGSLSAQLQELETRLNDLSVQYRSYIARKDISLRERQEALRELEIEIRQIQDRIRELQRMGASSEPIKADHNGIEPGAARATDHIFKAGFVLRELTPQLANYFGVSAGMLVVSIRKGSPAEKSGLRTGDVILGIIGREDMTMDQLRETLSTHKGDLSLKAMRNKNPLAITLAIQ
ncbi:MAG TPA: PDZ domain-containing protein [Blastocatellia bacterium]|nr:PDZ domain-containing protein [Blastocatellia bacterium]